MEKDNYEIKKGDIMVLSNAGEQIDILDVRPLSQNEIKNVYISAIWVKKKSSLLQKLWTDSNNTKTLLNKITRPSIAAVKYSTEHTSFGILTRVMAAIEKILSTQSQQFRTTKGQGNYGRGRLCETDTTQGIDLIINDNINVVTQIKVRGNNKSYGRGTIVTTISEIKKLIDPKANKHIEDQIESALELLCRVPILYNKNNYIFLLHHLGGIRSEEKKDVWEQVYATNPILSNTGNFAKIEQNTIPNDMKAHKPNKYNGLLQNLALLNKKTPRQVTIKELCKWTGLEKKLETRGRPAAVKDLDALLDKSVNEGILKEYSKITEARGKVIAYAFKFPGTQPKSNGDEIEALCQKKRNF